MEAYSHRTFYNLDLAVARVIQNTVVRASVRGVLAEPALVESVVHASVKLAASSILRVLE